MERQRESGSSGEVLDGSNIMELVENEEVFAHFVDHKFEQLDHDRDGQLSVKELKPAVADIGAALGLPAQGSSPDSDHIYSEVRAGHTLLFCTHSLMHMNFCHTSLRPVPEREPFIVIML